MRLIDALYRIGIAGLTLLAACSVEDRSTAPNEPVSSPTTLHPAAIADVGTILLEEPFEDNAFASRGWYDNTNIVTTPTQHASGSARALELHWTAGSTMPTSGGSARHLFPASPTLYVRYWVKYSSNWVGSGKAYHPHQFLVLSDQDGDYDGPSNNWLTAYLEDNYQNGGIPRLALQDNKAINTTFGALPLNLISVTENRSVGGCNGVVESGMSSECFSMPPWYNDKQVSAASVAFQPNPGPDYKGDWNQVEVYLQLNSVVGGIGQANGVMQYWFNGTRVIDRHDILFRTGARPNIQFHQFLIGPYIGDGSPVDQYMWVDNLTLATSRLAGTPGDSTVVPVASVTVAPGVVSQGAGATQQLTATLKDAAGNVLAGRSVVWTSSAPTVAMVGGSGLETGVAPGAATITATSEGRSGTAAITVATAKPNPVTALTLAAVTNNSATLSFTEVNDGTGKPANYEVRAAVGTISWGSVADVTQGTCKAPVVGTVIGAVRTCSVLGLAPSTAYQFQLIPFRGTLNMNAVFGVLSNVVSSTTAATPGAPVASVTVTPASGGINVGAALQLAAALKDASGNALSGRTVTWASSNTMVATVTPGGLVTGVGAGTAAITATSEGQSASATVAIANVPVALVTLTPATASVTVGATQQLVVTLKDGSGNILTGRSITWASSSPGIASVSASGLVTGVVAGTATIMATSEGKSGAATLTITSVPVASVTISPASVSLLVGATQQFAVSLKDANGNTLTGRSVVWASSNPTVVTVGSNGLVTGVLAGTASMTATSEGRSGTASVTVTATATKPGTVTSLVVAGTTANSVTLSFTEVSDGTGQPAKYDIRLAGGTISWGTATEVTQGTCQTPVAGAAIGAVRTCTVLGLTSSKGYQFQLIAFRGTLNLNAVFSELSNVVSATTTAGTVAPVASLTLSPLSATLALGGTQQVTAILKDASGNVLTGRTINWASSALLVATVSASGLVTGGAAGTATITATSEGKSGTAAISVTAPPSPPPQGGIWPNEPTGMALISDLDLSVALPSGTGDRPYTAGWGVVGSVTRVSDPTALFSAPYVMQMAYPTGYTGGKEPGKAYYNFSSNRTELYTAFWWKASAPWQGHNSGVNKLGFLYMGSGSSGRRSVVPEMFGSGSGPFYLRTALFETGVSEPRDWAEPNVGNGTLVPGTWYRIEIYVKYGTSSSSNNGVLKQWINGVLVTSYSDLNFPSGGFDAVEIDPTWGGIGDTKRENDSFSYDHIHISGR